MTGFTRVAAMAIFLAAQVSAQVTTINSDNPLPKGRDPNQMVCEREETTGTRLGARQVCLTVLQWEEKRTEHRQTLERVQRMNTSVGCQEGQTCGM
jgi:hypothetical protein